MESTINDLITTAVDQQPADFGNHFNSLMMDKIYAAVQERRAQISKSIYSTDDDVSEEEPTGEEDADNAEENA